MRNKFIAAAVATFLATSVPLGSARETVALPYIFGVAAGDSVGQATGVDTTGAGLFTVNSNINLNALGDTGGGITTDTNNVATILFVGNSTITGFTGTDLKKFFDIQAGANATIVNFNGDVFATTFHHLGNGIVNFNGDVNHTILASSYIFGGDGFLNLGANSIFTSAITTTAGNNTGTLTFNGGSSMVGAAGAGAAALKRIIIVGGNATITGAVFVKDIDLSANTLSMIGALTINPAGGIATTFASNTIFGKVLVNGASNIDAGGITVTPTVAGALTSGTTYRIVSAGSGTINAPVSVINNNPRYIFGGLPTTAGNLDIVLLSVAPLSTLVVSPDSLAVAPILDINALIGSDLRVVQDAIGSLSTANSIDNALAQLAPANTNLAAPWVATQATQLFSNTWIYRLDEIRDLCCDIYCDTKFISANKSDCKNYNERSNFWIKALGAYGKQGNVNALNGYKTDAYGAMAGYDMPISVNTLIGLGAGYIRSDIDGNNSLNQTKIDSYNLTAYLNYAPQPFFIRAALTAGLDKYDGSRQIEFTGINRIAKSEANGKQYSALLTAGKNFNISKTTITPTIGMQATRLEVDAYEEHDAGDINLRVDSQSYNFLQSIAGVKVERVIKSENLTVAPEVHAKWSHDLNSTTMAQDSVFTGGGSKFHVQGIEQDRNTYTVGAGMTFISCSCAKDTWSVKAAYDYKWNETNYHDNQVSVIASIKF